MDSLNNFGKTLIKEVRDRTIRLFDKRIQGKMKSEESQILFKRVSELGDKEKRIIDEIIPQVVDLCLHNMLCMFEENEEFKIMCGNENLADVSDGLAGELYTPDGWIEKYSEQRK